MNLDMQSYINFGSEMSDIKKVPVDIETIYNILKKYLLKDAWFCPFIYVEFLGPNEKIINDKFELEPGQPTDKRTYKLKIMPNLPEFGIKEQLKIHALMGEALAQSSIMDPEGPKYVSRLWFGMAGEVIPSKEGDEELVGRRIYNLNEVHIKADMPGDVVARRTCLYSVDRTDMVLDDSEVKDYNDIFARVFVLGYMARCVEIVGIKEARKDNPIGRG